MKFHIGDSSYHEAADPNIRYMLKNLVRWVLKMLFEKIGRPDVETYRYNAYPEKRCTWYCASREQYYRSKLHL